MKSSSLRNASISAFFAMPFSCCFIVAMGTKTINTTEAIVPMTINGVRRPHFLTSFPLALSEILPKSGNINNDKRLSSPIMKPRIALDNPYACSRRSGTTKS